MSTSQPKRNLNGTQHRLEYGVQHVASRCYLALEPQGSRIVEAIGEVAFADHIAVLVPGNGHDRQNYLRNAAQPDSLRVRAQQMLALMQQLSPASRVAVVSWVGYHTPPGLLSAVSNRPARAGAPDLARLTHYLSTSAHITLIGHSYGSTVCGLALAEARATDCVALGSPGMGVQRRDQLGTRSRLWAALGPTDWIRRFPRTKISSLGLGRSPLHPELGATRIATGEISGHCNYFDAGSDSLLNTARIAVGHYDEVSRLGVPTTMPVQPVPQLVAA